MSPAPAGKRRHLQPLLWCRVSKFCPVRVGFLTLTFACDLGATRQGGRPSSECPWPIRPHLSWKVTLGPGDSRGKRFAASWAASCAPARVGPCLLRFGFGTGKSSRFQVGGGRWPRVGRAESVLLLSLDPHSKPLCLPHWSGAECVWLTTWGPGCFLFPCGGGGAPLPLHVTCWGLCACCHPSPSGPSGSSGPCPSGSCCRTALSPTGPTALRPCSAPPPAESSEG